VLRVDAPANTRALAGIDPVLIARGARARAPVQEARLARRWCGTLWPTSALAQEAGMALDDYAAFVSRALFLDRLDPPSAWADLSVRQAKLVERLEQAREIRLEADGTDLTLRVDGRTWINSDGRRNMPSGEVFTGPLERSAQGTIRFSVPSSPRGVQVTGVELTFRDGEVIAARAERGEDYLVSALATDEGARRLGELGVGTNSGIDRATGHILLDEKIAGTVHLALGRSYPETGGINSSALHWDLICDLRGGGRLSADGEAVVDDGRIVELGS
jgi:aminopeptidase